MKVAVTGASGHIGSVLCRKLIDQGFSVRALVHDNEDDLKAMGVEIYPGDILDQKAVTNFLKNIDIVYHLAAIISIDNKNENLVYKTNLEGTRNVVEACKVNKVKRLVHFSTIHCLKVLDTKAVLNETNPLISDSKLAYEKAKAKAEELIIEECEKGFDAVVLNPTAVVGPNDFQPSYLGQALIKIYKNQLPMLVEGGYDFVDVRDVADGAILAAEKGRAGERYILGGKWISLKELSHLVSEVSGLKTPTKVVSPVIARIGLPFIHLWSAITSQHPLYTGASLDILRDSSRNISHKKAEKELGYNPVPMKKTLFDTFEWFKNQKMI